MAEGLSTMDMEALLGVPEYTILYWERCLPLVMPRKQFGRRQFSVSDACLLLRMRHYVIEKKLNPSQASNTIVEERMHAIKPEIHALHELRCEIITLYRDFIHYKNARKKPGVLYEEPPLLFQ